ncbi:hypothetical protein KIN20_029046 [Parelaphostrongylus tenuis]|uniref:Uncharacterized protein n=1 Tax=Parelaphostrongylus tenuis TaxID=148309 RepID=A0AAD5WFA4_PARTN|nr:hypothetical protein KIN20_029046 [Parelaphostrongylus tenuis]
MAETMSLAIVKIAGNLQFSENRDGSPSYSTSMMANPPMKNVIRFYFFNVSNPDEIIYNGAKPRLIETSAYAVMTFVSGPDLFPILLWDSIEVLAVQMSNQLDTHKFADYPKIRK